MFRVRKMGLQDFPTVIKLANSMNWNMGAADFQFSLNLEPNGCFVLLHDIEVVGLATCISYGQVGWFGNLVVDKMYREKGGGTELVRYAVEYLTGLGVKTVGLYAYPHLIDFYRGLGFKYYSDFVVLGADTILGSSEPGLKLETLKASNLSSVVDFDAPCFGSSRSKLFDLFFVDQKNLGYVFFEGTKLVGYVACKILDEVAEIGPLVCSRSRPEVAVDLLRMVLGKLKGLEASLYVSATESPILDAAYAAGFNEKFRLVKMCFGPNVAKNCIYLAESLERG